MVQMKFIALGLNCFTLILAIIAIANNYWFDNGFVHYGLWRACARGLCRTFPDLEKYLGISTVSGKLKVSRALEVLGILGLVASLACGGLKAFLLKDRSMFRLLSAWLPCISGVLFLVGAIVFATDPDDKLRVLLQVDDLYVGFFLAITAGIFSIFTGPFYLKVKDVE